MSSCISRILCLLSFVMINEKQTNAQNAHSSTEWSIGRKSVDSETKGNKMKLTGKQYRTIVELQGKETADMMASTLGVAQSRVGKLQYAPVEVQNAWDDFQSIVEVWLQDWNNALPAGSISKVDLNCKK